MGYVKVTQTGEAIVKEWESTFGDDLTGSSEERGARSLLERAL